MKQFYFLLLFGLIIAGCQQQQVPETIYDLDAQSIMSQTRAIQDAILYRAPNHQTNNQPVKIFKGYIASIAIEKGMVILDIKNLSKDHLTIELEQKVAERVSLDMEVMVRYVLDKRERVVLELQEVL